MECLLPYLCMVTVPHVMVGLERMLDYRGVGLGRFYCNAIYGGLVEMSTGNAIRYVFTIQQPVARQCLAESALHHTTLSHK